jgi:hypothetical protein
MDGDFSAELGSGKISSAPRAVLWDGGMTALMVLPAGSPVVRAAATGDEQPQASRPRLRTTGETPLKNGHGPAFTKA